MFWGVKLQPGRKYSQEVSHSYQITKAVLETPVDASSNKGQNKRVHVMLLHDGEEFVLATLDHTNVERSLDIHFSEGEKVCLFLKGEGTVHLTGYIVDFGDDEEDYEYAEGENPFVSAEEFSKAAKRANQQNGNGLSSKKLKLLNEDENGDDNDDSMDDEDDEFLGDLDEEYSDFDEMDDEEGLDFDEESEEEEVVQPKNKAQQQQQQKKAIQNQQPQQKKAQQTPQNNKGQQQKQQQQQQPQSQKKGQQTPQQQGQAKKVQQFEGKKNVPTPPAKFVSNKKTPDGLEIYDTVNGTGPVAKKGKTVYVKYVGRLADKKEFDRATNKPFAFRLGDGEVISGWDRGIEGMRVGGKRRLIIPPKLAYGNERTGPIPANSYLDFEVELVRVG